MSFFRPKLFAVVLLLALAVAAWAKPSTKPQGYDAFSTVRTRNIFDPERQPGVTAAAQPSTPQTPPPSRSDYAALTGIMITAEKALAFFSGSRPEFSKVLSAGGEIAGAKLVTITPASIEMERDGKRITIAVGQTVPLDGTSQPTSAPASIPVAAAPSSPATVTPSNSSSPAPDREALMRRMMEKRQQELK